MSIHSKAIQIDANLGNNIKQIDTELRNDNEPRTPVPSQTIQISTEHGKDTEPNLLTPLPVQIGTELGTRMELANPIPSLPTKIAEEIRKEMGLDNDDEHYNAVLPRSPESQLFQLINGVADLDLRSALESGLSQLLDQHANDYYILEEERLKWIEDKQELEEALADLTKRYEKAVRELNFFTTKSSELAAKGVQKRKSRKALRKSSNPDTQATESRITSLYLDQDPDAIPPWSQTDGNTSPKLFHHHARVQQGSTPIEERQDLVSSTATLHDGSLVTLKRRKSSGTTVSSSVLDTVAEERRKDASDDEEHRFIHRMAPDGRTLYLRDDVEHADEGTRLDRSPQKATTSSYRHQSSIKSRPMVATSAANQLGTPLTGTMHRHEFSTLSTNEYASEGELPSNGKDVYAHMNVSVEAKSAEEQSASLSSDIPPTEIVIVRPSFDRSPLETLSFTQQEAVASEQPPMHAETFSMRSSRDGSFNRSSVPLQQQNDGINEQASALTSISNRQQENTNFKTEIPSSKSSNSQPISVVDDSDNYLQQILSRPSLEIDQLLSATFSSDTNTLRPSLGVEVGDTPSTTSSRRASTIETTGSAELALFEQKVRPSQMEPGVSSPTPRKSMSSSRLSFDSDQESGTLGVPQRRRHKEIASMICLDKMPTDLKPSHRKNSGTAMSTPAMIPGLELAEFLQRRNESLKFGAADSGSMWSMFKVPDEHTIQKIVSNYLRRGGNPNVAKPTPNEGKILYGYGMLHSCIVNESIKCLTLLLQAGANPNAISLCSVDDDGVSPVYMAIKNGFMDGLQALVQYKADFAIARGPKQRTALIAAAECGDMRMLRYVIEMTEDVLVNVSDSQGVSALHWVCQNGGPDGVRLLAGEHGANIEVADSAGETCFHYAVKKGKFDVVKVLVEEFRADPNICVNKKVGTPVDAAKKAGHKKIEEYLRSAGGHPYKEWLKLTSKGKGGLLKF
ncbi:hypothetical protein BC936DRAFT_137262 [Jimgerdemannia flammicorona]|uniref:Uncharacterized protein n=1 Tax=Jimgerdemannia flammicorona TaxID=994334 RepID=A0A433CXT3_9FUNG|nr:hypothetical protein BC936DRAFT_137262 [Jimgerdemannia flammicorona]